MKISVYQKPNIYQNSTFWHSKWGCDGGWGWGGRRAEKGRGELDGGGVYTCPQIGCQVLDNLFACPWFKNIN